MWEGDAMIAEKTKDVPALKGALFAGHRLVHPRHESRLTPRGLFRRNGRATSIERLWVLREAVQQPLQ